MIAGIQTVLEQALHGLGLELVDCEWASGRTLRVYIDQPDGVSVDDCERASHQLGHVLTVENVDYERLEVSSPGLDRPLRTAKDFSRFVGQEAVVKLRQPFQGRKQFQGAILPLAEDSEASEPRLAIAFLDSAGVEQELSFTLSEIDKARLVPQIDFRSKKK